MSEAETDAWAERLWRLSMATRLDIEHRALAESMTEKVIEDPEQAAFLIAALVQLSE